jgi:hypothetical protein
MIDQPLLKGRKGTGAQKLLEELLNQIRVLRRAFKSNNLESM